jgi:acetoin:2,6-dichlorophenolindophenol oxidoreductase subunit alpha
MIRIRLFEEKVTELKLKGLISGPVHTCIGQEAVCAGVCLALSKEDFLIGNHRSHGHLIAKGTDVKSLMSQIFKGFGASMHVKDISIGVICSTAIVGSGLPLACGIAFASKFNKGNNITCVFFGDGAVNEGVFYESINLASIWHLPVLFILENNGVAVTTLFENTKNLIHRADAFEINQQLIDGQYVDDVFNATTRAIEAIKRNNRPAIIEAKTFRFHEHQEGVTYEKMKDTNYRDNDIVRFWQENKDPIQLYISKIIREDFIKDYEVRKIYLEENELINEAVEFAKL